MSEQHTFVLQTAFINELEESVSSEVIKSADDINLFKIKKAGDHYEGVIDMEQIGRAHV